MHEPFRYRRSPKNSAQRAWLEVRSLVDWHGHTARQIGRVPHLGMAPRLAEKNETHAFERADDSCPADLREAAQAALTSTVAIVV